MQRQGISGFSRTTVKIWCIPGSLILEMADLIFGSFQPGDGLELTSPELVEFSVSSTEM